MFLIRKLLLISYLRWCSLADDLHDIALFEVQIARGFSFGRHDGIIVNPSDDLLAYTRRRILSEVEL